MIKERKAIETNQQVSDASAESSEASSFRKHLENQMTMEEKDMRETQSFVRRLPPRRRARTFEVDE